MKKVAFITLGCKVNQYDSQAMAALFEKEGYKIVDFEETADIYVINTCTVTGLSARKSRQMIRRAKHRNKNAVVVAAGCYTQTAPEEVEKIPEVDLIIGTKERSKIMDFISNIQDGKGKINAVSDISKAKDFEELKVETFKERTRAFIKIQEGCNQFCSYCIIPYARGPIRSRDPGNVIDEIKHLAESGFKEVVLTGIHIASYGKDIKNTCLMDIIKQVHEIDGIERIRLGSVEPTIITEDFVNDAAKLDKLCSQYHLSLQSGCDQTLKRMNRKYTTSQYRTAVELLRSSIEDVSLTTDVMVGFPGETDMEFEQTYRFLEEIAFMKMHIFKYSPRKGTPAARFPNQVDPAVKEERSNRLIQLSEKNSLKFNEKFVKREMPVLFEQEVKSMKGYIEGFTTNYIKVICKGDNKLEGSILDVKMEKAYKDYIIGQIIKTQ